MGVGDDVDHGRPVVALGAVKCRLKIDQTFAEPCFKLVLSVIRQSIKELLHPGAPLSFRNRLTTTRPP
jgi:hypothetical protein